MFLTPEEYDNLFKQIEKSKKITESLNLQHLKSHE